MLLHLNQSHHRLSLSRTHSLAIMIETFISNKKATSYARFNLFFRHPTGFDAIVGFLLKVYGCSVRVLRKIKLRGGEIERKGEPGRLCVARHSNANIIEQGVVLCACVYIVCMCDCVCAPCMCMQWGSSGRGGAQIGQVFWGVEETLENSHTHGKLHVTRCSPADFQTSLFLFGTLFHERPALSKLPLSSSSSSFFFFKAKDLQHILNLDALGSSSKCARKKKLPLNRRMPPSPSDSP